MARIFSNPDNPTLTLSSWRSMDEVVPALNDYQPQVLSAYPTLMPELAAAARKGHMTFAPLVVIFVSEHLSQANYELARQTWPDAAILTFWGTSECGATFACPLGERAFHVSEDLAVIEPVDAAGRPVPPGKASDGIYLTNLFNRALPILRYHIDDIFEFSDEPCGCGSAFQKVADVRGRAFEKFAYGDTVVHPLTGELAVLRQPSIVSYQIRQTPGGTDIDYCSDGPVDADRLHAEVVTALRSYGLADPVVTIAPVSAIERTAVGKLKRFVPLARESAAA